MAKPSSAQVNAFDTPVGTTRAWAMIVIGVLLASLGLAGGFQSTSDAAFNAAVAVGGFVLLAAGVVCSILWRVLAALHEIRDAASLPPDKTQGD